MKTNKVKKSLHPTVNVILAEVGKEGCIMSKNYYTKNGDISSTPKEYVKLNKCKLYCPFYHKDQSCMYEKYSTDVSTDITDNGRFIQSFKCSKCGAVIAVKGKRTEDLIQYNHGNWKHYDCRTCGTQHYHGTGINKTFTFAIPIIPVIEKNQKKQSRFADLDVV